MRKLAAVLGTVFFLMLTFACVFYFGGTLKPQVRITTADAADYPEAFSAAKAIVDGGSAPQSFTSVALGAAAQYTLVDVNITLANRGFSPAEWLDIRVEPAAGDVAVYSLTGEGSTLPGRSMDLVNLKLITTARADAARAYCIQYYIYGMKREIEIQ